MADLNDLISDLESSISYLKEEGSSTVDDLGDIAVKHIRRLTPVKTGALKASIHHKKAGMETTVTSSKDYSDDVEYGHNQDERYVPALDKIIEAQFVKGHHMFENGMAKAQIELNAKVDEFIDSIPLFK